MSQDLKKISKTPPEKERSKPITSETKPTLMSEPMIQVKDHQSSQKKNPQVKVMAPMKMDPALKKTPTLALENEQYESAF